MGGTNIHKENAGGKRNDLIVLDWGDSVIVRSLEYLAQKIWKKNIKIICSIREVLELGLF